MNKEKLNHTVGLSLLRKDAGSCDFAMLLYPESTIFEGHFPNNPILPGVVMVATVKQALSLVFSTDCQMLSAQSIKFLGVIVPDLATNLVLTVTYSLEENLAKIDASMADATTTYFKMKAVYQLQA